MKNFKHKHFAFCICLTLIVSLLFTSSALALDFKEPSNTISGDVDGDQKVTSEDALLTLQHSVGKTTLAIDRAAAAKVSGSGDVSTADALLILQYSTGKIAVFPCDEVKEARIKELLNLKQELRFGQDGKFTVLQLSDPQEKGIVPPLTQNIIRSFVEAAEPDLVIFTGDNIYDDYVYQQTYGKPMDREGFIGYFRDLSKPMEEKGIPWCMVFGNHDSEFLPFSRKEQMEICMESFEHFVGMVGDENISGIGNYVLPVLRSDSDKIGFNVWALDTGDYLDNWQEGLGDQVVLENNLYNGSSYDYIHLDQQLWYWNTSVALEEYNGAKIPGAMYVHIPLNEFAIIAQNPGATGMTGIKDEGIGASSINSGMFTTILKRGDVKGFYAGHAHNNNFAGKYCGIELGFCGAISYYDYGGWEGHQPHRSTCSGRVLEVDENDAWNFTTSLLLYQDLI